MGVCHNPRGGGLWVVSQSADIIVGLDFRGLLVPLGLLDILYDYTACCSSSIYPLLREYAEGNLSLPEVVYVMKFSATLYRSAG